MQYVGSKHRIAKDILSEIDKVRASDQLLVEPFCGGCNFTIHARNPILAADSNAPPDCNVAGPAEGLVSS